jgi:ribonuclease HI
VCLLPISFSLLAFSSDALVGPLLAFNSAVWRFRNPAQASRLVQPKEWLIARIVELASALHRSIKPAPSKKRKRSPTDLTLDIESDRHNSLLDSATASTAICYTDGSASPNPGPSGAAACVFLRSPDQLIDLGISLGKGTNNAAEIHALTLLFKHLVLIKDSRPLLCRAIIFSDSQLAISACTSTKIPGANRTAVLELREAFAKLSLILVVDLHWIRGHSNYGGNERVDRVAKLCASTDKNSHLFSLNEWVFGFPLYNSPIACFLRDLPAPARSPPLVDGSTPDIGPPDVGPCPRSVVSAVRRSARLSLS